jgi:hypothetical protein
MPPRTQSDPDRYIRVVKGGKYQARPVDLGERFDLGLFPTKDQARAALREFWWGRRPDTPRFTRRVHTRAGPRYHAHVVVGATRANLGLFPTREAAARAVVGWLREHHPGAADRLLRRVGRDYSPVQARKVYYRDGPRYLALARVALQSHRRRLTRASAP